MFPARHGISEHCSPETLVTGKAFNHDKHCQIECGDCTQADNYNDPRNDMQPRCTDGMHLRPADNNAGHHVMDLQTGRDIIRGGPITIMPLTNAVKERIEKMAKKQGHDKLKFKKKSGETMPHEDLSPGTDYDALNEYEDQEEEEQDEEQVKIFEEEHKVETAVEDDEEEEINKEQQRFFEDDLNNEEEGVIEEPEEEDAEQMIDELIEAFHDDALPEGEELLDEVADDVDKEQQGKFRPIRLCREPERLTYAQVTTRGTIRVGNQAFQQVIKEQEHNLFAQTARRMTGICYQGHESLTMAKLMEEITTRHGLMTQHMLHKGLKMFGEKGVKAIGKEVGQLHDWTCFRPMSIKSMNANKRRRAQVALAHLGEKGNNEVKGRVVFNGKPTRECLGKEDSASPAASMESIFLTCVTDACAESNVPWIRKNTDTLRHDAWAAKAKKTIIATSNSTVTSNSKWYQPGGLEHVTLPTCEIKNRFNFIPKKNANQPTVNFRLY